MQKESYQENNRPTEKDLIIAIIVITFFVGLAAGHTIAYADGYGDGFQKCISTGMSLLNINLDTLMPSQYQPLRAKINNLMNKT